jgi:hypothetical protein
VVPVRCRILSPHGEFVDEACQSAGCRAGLDECRRLTPQRLGAHDGAMGDVHVDSGAPSDGFDSEVDHLFDEETNDPETVLSLTQAEQLRLWIALNEPEVDS